MKGQLLIGEFVIACGIFLIILLTLLSLWDSAIRDIITVEREYELEDVATSLAETLVRSPGFPENWQGKDLPDIVAFGLAKSFDEPRVLDRTKVLNLSYYLNTTSVDLCPAMGISNYECSKYLLGPGALEYVVERARLEYYIEIVNLTDHLYVLDGLNCTFGKKPLDGVVKQPAESFAVLEGKPVKVRVIVWTR